MDKSIDDKENLDRFDDDEEGGKKYNYIINYSLDFKLRSYLKKKLETFFK